ncbi:MAG: amidohydrolase family protein [Gemmatimonadaceae bacterium]
MICARVIAASLGAVVLCGAVPVAAQDSTRTDTPAADTAKSREKEGLPLKPTRTIRFTTDEGTWLSLDVSPDGKTIVFDLAGDLYTLPIAGGTATRITSGMAFDAQPRYSPDGKNIVFSSDRSGAENLWLVEPDGKNARALTKGDKGQYISPEWTPDGNYIVVSRSTTDVRASTYELYLYHREGGTGVKLAGASGAGSSAPQAGAAAPLDNYLGAAFGSDPRYVYVSVKRGGFGYNLQFPLWQIAVYDRETGKTHTRTNAHGSALRPVLSADGKYMVYGTRADSVTSLRLREMASGDETVFARSVQRDDQESRYTRDNMPGSSFTPDGRSFITAYDGKIWRLEVPSGKPTQIPFSADVEQQMGPLVSFDYAINDSTLTVQQIRDARLSPNGRRLAFTALDRVWIMDLPEGTPSRLTTADVGEHSPVWSPDGRFIAYVTWTEEGGDVYRASVPGGGSSARGGRGARRATPERLTRQTAFYQSLNYTPDGTKLVVARGPRQPRIQEEGMYGLELVWLPAVGGTTTTIAPLTASGWPHFTRTAGSERIYIYDRNDGLISMRFDGTDVKSVIKVTGFLQPGGGPNARPNPADEILISPTGDRAIAQVGNNVYLVTVPMVGGQGLTVSALKPATAPVPMKRITRVGGDFMGWTPDSKRFYYSLGHSFFIYDIALADSLVRDSTERADSSKAKGVGAAGGDEKTDTAQAGKKAGEAVALAPTDSAKVTRADTSRKAKAAYEPARLDVLITVARDRPSGTLVLRGARIITMKGEEVIEKGDVLVRDNRIAAVGPAGSLQIPAEARVIDVSGKTILPGWIDIHAHLRPSFGIHKTQVWEYLANLAYGVTTTRDPQTGTTDVLSYGDLVETGDMLGPRIFSTGPGVFWSEDIASLDDARDVLRRYSDFYNIHTIKQYGAGDRKVRQWIIMAAKELGLMPTSENYLDFKKNLTEAIDGYPGAEHSYPIVPLFKDAIEIIAKSGITYTPTFLVSFGGPSGEEYWYQQFDITKDAKLQRFTPKSEIIERALRRGGWFHNSQFIFPLEAAQAAKIVAAGGRVGLGGHGQLQGLGVHWELWSIASGGMPSHDVLRVGTTFGAQAIGLRKELGTLEGGKLADLQVLDANPLENIRNTNTLRYVMKNGRLYDGGTLAEIWPRQREIKRPWWWDRTDVITATGSK